METQSLKRKLKKQYGTIPGVINHMLVISSQKIKNILVITNKNKNMKTVNIKLGYYPNGGGVTGRQLGYIQRLLEKDYKDAYHHYITKYGSCNPFNRLNKANASKLIDGLLKEYKIVFLERV
jgi:hypothetical protein